jgi:hypothetical protein
MKSYNLVDGNSIVYTNEPNASATQRNSGVTTHLEAASKQPIRASNDAYSATISPAAPASLQKRQYLPANADRPVAHSFRKLDVTQFATGDTAADGSENANS